MVKNPNLRSEGDINTTDRRRRYSESIPDESTRSLLERDAAVFLHQSLSTPCLDVIESCEGATITLQSGRTLLDFHGNYIHNLGFSHPAIVEAVIRQLGESSFCTRRYTNRPAIELAEKLGSLTQTLKRVLFAPGGAEAISMALKIARIVTGRHKVISLWDSFHGATLDAVSAGGESAFRLGIGPLLPGVEHAPSSNPSDCPFECGSHCNERCARYIEYMLEKEGDVSAVLAETIRSTPFIPPPGYWKIVRAACDKHGAILILDEIPHALGRTGKMFAFQHYGIEPDIVVLGKGLGGGIIPFAAIIARNEFNEALKTHSVGHFTHEKSPVASAAALAMLRVIEEEELLAHVNNMNLRALDRMLVLKSKYSAISDVRAIGLMMGIELTDPVTGEKAYDLAEEVMYRSIELGLNFKLSMGNVVNLTPPMNVSVRQLEDAFNIIDKALEESR